MTTTGLFITDLPDGVTTPARPNSGSRKTNSRPTTLAVGEEGDDGDDGDDDGPTTLAVGEEGGDHDDDGPTTLAVGEEGEDED